MDFYFLDGVRQHTFERFYLLYDVVNILLFVLPKQMLVFLHILAELPLQLLSLLLIKDAGPFFFLVHLPEIYLLLNFGDVEDRSDVLH